VYVVYRRGGGYGMVLLVLQSRQSLLQALKPLTAIEQLGVILGLGMRPHGCPVLGRSPFREPGGPGTLEAHSEQGVQGGAPKSDDTVSNWQVL
jgi:hypothetical protein